MNQKGFVNILLTVLVVVLAGTVGYLTLVKKQPQPSTQLTPTPTGTAPTPTPKSETTNSKTYRNDKFGFEFKYPTDFELRADEFSIGVNVTVTNYTVRFPNEGDPSGPLDEANLQLLFSVYSRDSKDGQQLEQYNKSQSAVGVSLGQNTFYKYQVTNTDNNIKASVYYLVSPNNKLFFYIPHRALLGKDWQSNKDFLNYTAQEKAIENILSTFKFIP